MFNGYIKKAKHHVKLHGRKNMADGAECSVVAPTIICKRCGKNTVKNYFKCVKCGSVFHQSCAKLFKGLQILNDSSAICCESNTNESDAFFDALEKLSEDNRIDLSILNYIVRQKDNLISELQEKIKILNDHINLLNTFHIRKDTIKECEQKLIDTKVPYDTTKTILNKTSDKKLCTHKTADIYTTNKNKHKKSSTAQNSTDSCLSNVVAANKKPNLITNTQLSHDLMTVESQLTMDKYINLTKEKECQAPHEDISADSETVVPGADHSGNNWMAARNKKRRRPVVTGNNIEAVSRVKGVPKMIALHVYRLSPSTTVKDLEEHLQNTFTEVSCEALVSKHPNLYSSFKVHILETNFKKAMDPKLWPYGCCIQRFFEIAKKDPVIK